MSPVSWLVVVLPGKDGQEVAFRLLETAEDSSWSAEGVRPTLNVRMDAQLVPSPAFPEGAPGILSDMNILLILFPQILKLVFHVHSG